MDNVIYSQKAYETVDLALAGENMIACSAEMQELIRKVEQIAGVDCTVLLTGETGVGKGVIAKLLHSLSHRKDSPFVHVNCGAIPDTLMESELFGYESGAFTGARREGKPGQFELAGNGTIFLDEIGELPFNMQSKLLQVLQEGELTRIGGNKPRRIQARTIAATNKDLWQMVMEGTFREDLYFRLNVIPLVIPPLHKRREDIIPLVLFYKKKFEKKYGFKKTCSREVLRFFHDYDWPGNIRELKNIVERIFVMSPPDKVITPEEIIKSYMNADWQSRQRSRVQVNGLGPLKELVKETEAQVISMALQQFGTLTRAAEVLQVDTSTLSRKARTLRLTNYQ